MGLFAGSADPEVAETRAAYNGTRWVSAAFPGRGWAAARCPTGGHGGGAEGHGAFSQAATQTSARAFGSCRANKQPGKRKTGYPQHSHKPSGGIGRAAPFPHNPFSSSVLGQVGAAPSLPGRGRRRWFLLPPLLTPAPSSSSASPEGAPALRGRAESRAGHSSPAAGPSRSATPATEGAEEGGKKRRRRRGKRKKKAAAVRL